MAPFSANGSVVQGCFPHGLPQHLSGVAQPHARVQNGTAACFRLPEHLTASARSGTGERLPQAVQAKMESLFGTSFADVRVHVGRQPASLGATALTHGTNIYFLHGQYNPATRQGVQLLAHELTHVVHQRGGKARNPFGAGVAVLHDRGLEAEADRMAARALLGPPQSVQPKMNTPAAMPPRASGVVQRTTILQPGYTTGDMFGIAATLTANPNMHVVIARGPRPGRPLHDMTDKADMIAGFYLESGVNAARVHILDVPDVRRAARALKDAGLVVERNHLNNASSKTQIEKNDLWPVGSGTTFIARRFAPGMRVDIRDAWGVNARRDDEIAVWLRSKGIPIQGRRVAILWSRFSGKKGDIHLEHDSSYFGMLQIVKMAAPYYDAILITGDASVQPGQEGEYGRLVRAARACGARNVFNITGFWTEQSQLLRAWMGYNTRTGQFRLYDYLNRHFDSARHLGFRSGNLEAMALMGFTVRYMEEPDSEGSERMEKWHDRGNGITSEGGMASGYERLRVDAPPTRSGKYLKDTMNWKIFRGNAVVTEERWGQRPIWAPGRQSIVAKPSSIRYYKPGFSERDLLAIGQYLQVPDQRMMIVPAAKLVPASDPQIRIAQQFAARIMGGLDIGTSLSDIDRRFRAVARLVHSDKTGKSDEKMQALVWARDVLRGDFSQIGSARTHLLALTAQ
jgi:hypothetical protein